MHPTVHTLVDAPNVSILKLYLSKTKQTSTVSISENERYYGSSLNWNKALISKSCTAILI